MEKVPRDLPFVADGNLLYPFAETTRSRPSGRRGAARRHRATRAPTPRRGHGLFLRLRPTYV